MTEKWTEKEVMEHAKALKSPFESIKQNGQGKGLMPNLAEKIKELALKNKGMKTQ